MLCSTQNVVENTLQTTPCGEKMQTSKFGFEKFYMAVEAMLNRHLLIPASAFLFGELNLAMLRDHSVPIFQDRFDMGIESRQILQRSAAQLS